VDRPALEARFGKERVNRYHQLQEQGLGLTQIFRTLRREKLQAGHRAAGEWISIAEAARRAGRELEARQLPAVSFGSLWEQVINRHKFSDFEVRSGKEFEEPARAMTSWGRKSTGARVQHPGNANFVHESMVGEIVKRAVEGAKARAIIKKYYYPSERAAAEVGLGSKTAIILHLRNGFPHLRATVGGFRVYLVPKVLENEKGELVPLKEAFALWREARESEQRKKAGPLFKQPAGALKFNKPGMTLNLLPPKAANLSKPKGPLKLGGPGMTLNLLPPKVTAPPEPSTAAPSPKPDETLDASEKLPEVTFDSVKKLFDVNRDDASDAELADLERTLGGKPKKSLGIKRKTVAVGREVEIPDECVLPLNLVEAVTGLKPSAHSEVMRRSGFLPRRVKIDGDTLWRLLEHHQEAIGVKKASEMIAKINSKRSYYAFCGVDADGKPYPLLESRRKGTGLG